MLSAGDRITRGVDVKSLDHDKKWNFKARAQKGDIVKGGVRDRALCRKAPVVEHTIMVPAGIRAATVTDDQVTAPTTLDETVAALKDRQERAASI